VTTDQRGQIITVFRNRPHCHLHCLPTSGWSCCVDDRTRQRAGHAQVIFTSSTGQWSCSDL